MSANMILEDIELDTRVTLRGLHLPDTFSNGRMSSGFFNQQISTAPIALPQ